MTQRWMCAYDLEKKKKNYTYEYNLWKMAVSKFLHC